MNTTEGKKWGLTAVKQAELFALSQDVGLKRSGYFNSLYDSTVRFALHAIDLCKGEQKDAARNWHRYFQSAQIFELLETSSEIEHYKIVDLRLVLEQLKGCCHPEERISLETDIQHIRSQLEKLLELAQQNQAPAFPFFNSHNRVALQTN